MDARAFGNRLEQRDAYRVARGEEIMASSGQPVRLSSPLDWLVATEHSDGMGLVDDVLDASPLVTRFEQGARWSQMMRAGGEEPLGATLELIGTFAQGKMDPALLANYSPGSRRYATIWEDVIQAAEEFNDPGEFTTLIGFEWSSLVAGGNRHRNVIFRDGGDRVRQVVPYTTQEPIGSNDPLDLYEYLENYEAKRNGAVLATAHNGNLSNGIMFPVDAQYTGRKLDKAYVEQRAKWERMNFPLTDTEVGKIMGWEQLASGLTAVWAQENTREAIFDAMDRREVYATTGTRITVRFFGGWDCTATDINSRSPAFRGYEKGVPMGGDLPPAAEGAKAPTFMVDALRDPIGANLDRIQIVKGWLEADGETQEKVYDVVWSDGRKPGADGRLPPVGNTVDVANATWTNTIGASEIGTVWTDPEFDSSEAAFYYVRVLEIPTPPWYVYDAFRFGVDLPEGAPTSQQERAYTSPIWYTPKG
jgi:hypothetical protein